MQTNEQKPNTATEAEPFRVSRTIDAIAAKIREATTETPQQRADRESSEGRAALLRERSRRQGELAKLVRAAGARYAECSLRNFHVTTPAQRTVVKAVGEYIDLLRDAWESTGLVLYGKVGTGKDHLAFAVARFAIEDLGKSVAWVNGQSWFGSLREAIDKQVPESVLLGSLISPDLLVLSDPLPPAMGRGDELTPYQAAMLYRLVDARYSRGQITVITVNVNDDDEADRRMGTPTWDRVCHGAWKIHCDWPTYRKPVKTIG